MSDINVVIVSPQDQLNSRSGSPKCCSGPRKCCSRVVASACVATIVLLTLPKLLLEAAIESSLPQPCPILSGDGGYIGFGECGAVVNREKIEVIIDMLDSLNETDSTFLRPVVTLPFLKMPDPDIDELTMKRLTDLVVAKARGFNLNGNDHGIQLFRSIVESLRDQEHPIKELILIADYNGLRDKDRKAFKSIGAYEVQNVGDGPSKGFLVVTLEKITNEPGAVVEELQFAQDALSGDIDLSMRDPRDERLQYLSDFLTQGNYLEGSGIEADCKNRKFYLCAIVPYSNPL